ncbi:12260_t:CDS:2 [Ambispora gerdemannii]|uniref:12260_t:CDS:1 n=1 Tax=Ambispora gerdemannii TaxID=144530 RepID=A0A9N9BSW1_9GLOM|nr:12260_t:CDS:2 [Ambispora gerdemannii]
MTSDNDEEILQTLELLKEAASRTGYLSQAFWFDDSRSQIRNDFGVANSLFGEAILQLAHTKPHIIFDVPPNDSSYWSYFLYIFIGFLVINSCLKKHSDDQGLN